MGIEIKAKGTLRINGMADGIVPSTVTMEMETE
jgi:hypothetical protein